MEGERMGASDALLKWSKVPPYHKYSKLINFVNGNGGVKVKSKPTYGLVEFHQLIVMRTSPITHLKAWTYMFIKKFQFWWHFSKLAPKSADPDSWPKNPVLGHLFGKNSLFWPILTKWRPPSVIHSWKAIRLQVLSVKPNKKIPQPYKPSAVC